MKRKKQYCTAILVALSVGMFMQSDIVFAASTDEPEFGNSAEALRAANQARDIVSTNSNLKESLSNVEKAQISVNKAVKSGDPNTVTTTSLALEKAEEAYMRELASVSGVIETDILSMRDSGMEWRQVGHELGIHSGMLGFGHGGERSNQISGVGVDALELNEATAINPNNGWSQGHGMNIQSGVNHSGSGFMGMNKWNGNNSGEITGAGGIQHGNSSSSNWGRNGNSSMNDNNMNMNNNMNDNHDNNMNNNMNDNHNNNMNDNMNDNHNNNMNDNMNDNHNNNMNDNMNDNHNNNSNNNMNDNHNSNRSGNSGGGGWGGNSGSRGGGRW